MRTKGVKVKALAKELGVTSPRVIDRCRAEGIDVQNSASKLSHQEAQRVRAGFRSETDSGSSPHQDLNPDGQQCLASPGAKVERDGLQRAFHPIPIRGEPASTTLIRERR